MSNNPYGHTGKRSVKYISPNHTQVIYEDRVLDIKTTGETGPEFASKVKARTGKVPAGYKTKEQAYKDRRARNKAASEKKKAQAKAKTASSKAKTTKKTPSKKPAASAAKKSAAPKTTSKPTKMNALEAGLASGKYVFE